jgi:hypothetical protein
LTVENGELIIVDTGSRNGTFLNDIEITRNTLKNGDLIRIGPHELTVQDIIKTEIPGFKPRPMIPQPTLSIKEETITYASRFEDRLSGQRPTANPAWWDKLPPKIRSYLEMQDLDFKALPQQFLLALTTPTSFFETAIFDGAIRTSLMVIFICGFFTGLINIRFGFFMPLAVGCFSVIGYGVLCSLLHVARIWLSVSGEFAQFLRFCAYISLMAVPFSLAGTILLPLGPLMNLIIFAWSAYGFYTAFRPRLTPVLILGGVLVLFFGAAWTGLIGLYLSNGQNRFTHNLSNSKTELLAQTSLPDQTNAEQPAVAPVAARTVKKERSNTFRTFVGDFHLGEAFQYWVQLAGPGIQREGLFSVAVKSVDDMGAVVLVNGQIAGLKKQFEKKIGWEMDLTEFSAGSSRIAEAELEQVMNLLISHRVMLVLMGFTPDSEVPKPLLQPRPMNVAGIKADYFQSLTPSRSVASTKSNYDIAVSKDYGLPLFIQSRNLETNERIYLMLKSYKK